MVSALFSVKHNHCGLCGEQRPLFVLNLTSGELPRLEPKQDGTHAGVCMACWGEVAEVLRPRRDPYAAQKAMEGTVRVLLTMEPPSAVVDESVRILREGLTKSMFKQRTATQGRVEKSTTVDVPAAPANKARTPPQEIGNRMALTDKAKQDALFASLTSSESLVEMLGHFRPLPGTGLTDPDDVPPTPDEPTTKPGDMWLLGAYYQCEDCGKVYDYETGKTMQECPCG